MNHLRETYKRFLSYEKECFLKDSGGWFGVEKVDQKTKEDFFKNYYKISFFKFLSNVKNLVYPSQAFDFIEKGWGDNWEMEVYISFLKREKLISLRNGKIIIKNKSFFDFIPKIKNKEEIVKTIEKRSKVKIEDEKTTLSFIENFNKFKVKGEWDQIPLSQSSAIFCVEKILEHIPLNGKFLFVGDDDFLSIFLSLADENIESLVIDADEELLKVIDDVALKLSLKIETRLVDTRKEKDLGENFVGFSCNPPYTEKGVRNFMEYGVNQLGVDGGNVFLIMGTENIGNRLLYLQKYFTQKKLLIAETITGKFFYPYLKLHGEDETNLEKMKKHFSEQMIQKKPFLAADLWIFNYVPFEVKRVNFKSSIYNYL